MAAVANREVIGLYGNLVAMFDLLGVFNRRMCNFPLSLEPLQLLAVGLLSIHRPVKLLELGDGLVLDDHLLVVAPALRCGPFREIFRESSKDLANSE